jgi:hypothetical protein
MAPTSATDPLVEVLGTRLRTMDLVAWQRIATLAEERGLSFEDLRMLLALSMMDGPAPVHEFGNLAGFSLEVAYRATHSLRQRGYLRDERRQYVLSEKGNEIVDMIDAAHREGIQAYVDQLDNDEREKLMKSFVETRSTGGETP